MSRPIHIYALTDSSGVTRYVGKTALRLAKRLGQHVAEARRGHNCYRCYWIRQQMNLGLHVKITSLEETSDADWEMRERFWIAHYRDKGYCLTNCTDGGEGLHGHSFSPEHRARIGAKSKGRKKSAEELKKMADAARGRRKTAEELRKQSLAMRGRRFTEEHKAKIGAKSRGRKASPETLAKQSAAHKGWQHTEASKAKLSMSLKGRTLTDMHRERISKSKMRPVLQLDIHGAIVGRFDSIQDAAKSLGVFHGSLTPALKWPGRSCRGFKWMYCDQLPGQPKLWGNLPAYEPRRLGRPAGKKIRSADALRPVDASDQSSRVEAQPRCATPLG